MMIIQRLLSKRNGLITFILLILFLLLVNRTSAGASTVPLQEADLYSGGNAAGIYKGADGTLFILDQELELWEVNPQTGDYKDFYPVGGDELMDISLEDENKVWWVDNTVTFGNLNLTNGSTESWDIVVADFMLDGQPLQLGPLIYEDNQVWLASFYGPKFGIFKYAPVTQDLCLYPFTKGLYASDLIEQGGRLWALDWRESESEKNDALFAMDPDSGHLVKYSLGRDIKPYANLKTDGIWLWWTENVPDGALVRFNPATGVLTAFGLPAGERAVNLDLQDGAVWYTNYNGSFGRLNPGLAAYTTATLTEQVIANSITPTCVGMEAPYTDDAGPETGTFSWADGTSEMTEPLTGVQVYSLPTGAVPFGIGGAGEFIWVSDPGRQKLVRMSLSEVPPDYQVYLPLVLK